MTISINEFSDRISNTDSELYLLFCTEVLVYDSCARTLYIPASTHGNTNLNPLADFRTHIGHFLLWSRHTEVECSSGELMNTLVNEGYTIAPTQVNADYTIYTLIKEPCALKKAI